MRIKASLKNISVGILGDVVTQLVAFGVRTVFIYTLGIQYLGLGGLFTNIFALLSLAELGLVQAMNYSLYKPLADADKEKISTLISAYRQIYKIIFLVVLSLGIAFTPFVHLVIKNPNALPHIELIYMLYVVIASLPYLFAAEKSLLFADQKNYISNRLSIIFYCLQSVMQITMLYLTGNYFVFLITQLVFDILLNFTIKHQAHSLYPYLKTKAKNRLEPQEKKSIAENAKALLLYKIGTVSLNSTDNIVISKIMGLAQVGLFSNYMVMSAAVNGMLSTIFGNITASIGNFNAVESTVRKKELFRRLNLISFLCFSSCGICLYCCLTPFVKWWLGSQYALSPWLNAAIAANMFVSGMLYAPYNFRQTMGLFRHGRLRPIISAIINIILSIIMGLKWGLPGVLWATVLTRLATNAWFDPYIVLCKGLSERLSSYILDYLGKAMLFALALLVNARLFPISADLSIIAIILRCLASMSTSIALLSLPFIFSDDMKYFFVSFKAIANRGS